MKHSPNPFDFWSPSLQAATVLTEANIAMTLRLMDMAASMNPLLAPRPQSPCGVAPAAKPQTQSKPTPKPRRRAQPAPKNA